MIIHKSIKHMIKLKKRNQENYLVTGSAGFIGMHCAIKLLERGDLVVGVDNLNDYYDVNLKIKRLSFLQNNPSFKFLKTDISNKNNLEELLKQLLINQFHFRLYPYQYLYNHVHLDLFYKYLNI